MAAPLPSEYRLAPQMVARLVGLYLVLLAVVMFVAAPVVAVAHLTPDVLVGLLLVGLTGLFVAGWWLRSRAVVLQCTEAGYRVRLVRGAGVHEARWTDVKDAVTTTTRNIPCVVLRLKDGRTTTIPVGVLAADKEEFVRQLRRHLQRGQKLRPLG